MPEPQPAPSEPAAIFKLDYDPPAPAPLLKPAPLFPELNGLPGTSEAAPPANPARLVQDSVSPASTGTATENPNGIRAAESKAGPFHVGSVTFEEAAKSMNAVKTEFSKPDDLASQYKLGVAATNVVQATPITGWAVVALSAVAVVLGLIVGHFESTRLKHKHRHRNRKHSQSRRSRPEA